jgi:hypothetical protein
MAENHGEHCHLVQIGYHNYHVPVSATEKLARTTEKASAYLKEVDGPYEASSYGGDNAEP